MHMLGDAAMARKPKPDDAARLRQRAEEALRGSPSDASDLSPEAVGHLIHELQVHQIELELQNEELQRAYLEIEKSRDRYSDLYDFAPAGYLTLNEDGRIVEANLTSAKWLGQMRTKLVGRRFSDFVAAEDQDTLQLHLKKHFAQQPEASCEIQATREDGTHFYLRLDSILRADSQGQPVVRLALSDITERKRAELALQAYQANLEQRVEQRTAELRMANRALQENEGRLRRAVQKESDAREVAEHANEVKAHFLAMISHELRTPLTAIKGASTSLLSTDVAWSAEQQQEFLVMIDAEADRLSNLVEQLLQISRLQASVWEVKPVPVQLHEVVSQAMPQLEGVTANHQLEVHLPGGLRPVMVDQERIGQVITNLVENAAKFSPQHTTIALTAREDGAFIQVDVSDQGPGIPPEEHSQVFEPFHQVAMNGGLSKGVGLGLAICKGLIEAHGGQIWINNQDRPGCTISFTVPIASE